MGWNKPGLLRELPTMSFQVLDGVLAKTQGLSSNGEMVLAPAARVRM